MRYLLFCFMASSAMLVWACGADPAANDGGGAGGSGGACVPSANAAGICSGGPVQCVVPEGMCSCDTDAGLYLCPEGEPPGPDDPRGLPATQPKNGDCCWSEGMTCGGWDICAPICHCKEGKWSCKDPDCPLFFCPDPVEKLTGQFCDDRIGDFCNGSEMGCFDACTCVLDYGLGRGVWQCSGPECAFDGGFGDASPPPPIDDGGVPPPFEGGPAPPPTDAGPFDDGSVGDGG
jgi:hypothetical protein